MGARTISDIQGGLRSGEFTLPDLVEDYLRKISERNDAINAVISVDEERGMDRARRIQEKVEQGDQGKLAGAVVGIKDLICEKGKRTTCASRILQDFESIYDATVIERLREEDALLLGRLNMDEFAMGSSNENSIYGPVRNPHDTERVPGGSSGGSAAAVASEFCTAALGSDTGGSIRQPASYCGVVGVKPTYGRVSRHGLVAFASSFDCIGPLTHNVVDSARILEVIAGYDSRDNTSSSRGVPDYRTSMENPDPSVRIGVPEDYFGEGLDREIREGIMENLEALEAEGAELVSVRLPHAEHAIATYYILATAEASSNLARYDGVRYGRRAELGDEEEGNPPLDRLYKKSRTEGFGEEVKRRIMLGTYVLSAGYYDAYYAKGQKVRRLIKEDFTRAFEKVDVIASPTAPTTAFRIGEKTDDPLQMYLNDMYTISANLAGICSINVPAGIHSNGLPYGMQFMADAFQESEMFNAARLVEELA